ncbi:MAG: polyprenyl synthetase family protein [Deltaproteobacteria bacterium]|nr:polyprenyl synthetase family protein [Deltaproteobacteria bacterium]
MSVHNPFGPPGEAITDPNATPSDRPPGHGPLSTLHELPGSIPFEAAPKPPAALLAFSQLAEPKLREFLDQKRVEARELPVDLWPAFAATRDYVLRGGKRLRGALVLLGNEAGNGLRDAALPAALGVELLHAYLLVHDDFMDRDELRRGAPTLHILLGEKAALDVRGTLVAAGEHVGGSLALLFGSLLQAWAIDLVLSSPVIPERRLAAGRLLARALAEVTVGQALDLAAPLGAPLGAEGTLEIERLKTGSYTFEMPLLLGAHLAGAEPRVLEALSRFARPLGQAFQIVDDLLGVFGAPAVTGKSAGGDLREGKRTLIVLRALEEARGEDLAHLHRDLGRRDMNDREVDALRALLRRLGAESRAKEEAHELAEQARAALDTTLIPDQVATQLEELAVYTVERTN